MQYEHKASVLEIAEQVGVLVPYYKISAVDVNEALDPNYSAGNCAVRAYLMGTLINRELGPSGGIMARFGFTEWIHGMSEDYIHTYGHAALRLDSADGDVVILDSREDPKGFLAYDTGSFPYRWYGVEEGYRTYLSGLEDTEVEFSSDDVLRVSRRRIANEYTEELVA